MELYRVVLRTTKLFNVAEPSSLASVKLPKS